MVVVSGREGKCVKVPVCLVMLHKKFECWVSWVSNIWLCSELDDDNGVGGGSEDEGLSALIIPWIIFHGTNIYVVDNFIDNGKHPAELGEANPQQLLSWLQLPDWEDGFGQFLTEILERSVNSGGRNLVLQQPTVHPDDALVQLRMPPTTCDFLFWQVACRVRLLNSFNENFHVKSI